MNTTLLAADARNRALRTILQGLAYCVLFAVGLVLYNAFRDADQWSQVDWRQLGFSAVQAAVMAGFAYFNRRRLDSSSIPTPLPPEHPGEPNVEFGTSLAEREALEDGGVISNTPLKDAE